MKNQSVQIHNLVQVMRITALKDLRDLSAINCGSDHKTKDEIIHTVSDIAMEAAAFQELMLSCIDHVNAGYSVEDYINFKAEQLNTDSSLCKPDKIRSRELLDKLMEYVIEVN